MTANSNKNRELVATTSYRKEGRIRRGTVPYNSDARFGHGHVQELVIIASFLEVLSEGSGTLEVSPRVWGQRTSANSLDHLAMTLPSLRSRLRPDESSPFLSLSRGARPIRAASVNRCLPLFSFFPLPSKTLSKTKNAPSTRRFINVHIAE